MLRVITPVTVTEAMVVSTNVAENDAPEWDNSTTYAAQSRVIVSATHTLYESAADGNVGNDPSLDDGTNWLEVSATNPWRAFDRRLSAPVENTGTITYLIEPGALVRGVGLVGASALTATVRVKNSGGDTLVERTKSLADYSDMVDAVTMVTVQPTFQSIAVFEDIICTPGNRVEVQIGDSSGTAQVSEIVLGDVLTIGTPLYGTEVGADDFSDYQTDQFGNVDIVERGYRDVTEFPVAVTTGSVPRIKRELTSIRSAMALYYTNTEGGDLGTNVYGRYESLRQIIAGPNISDMNLRILGATYGA